MFDTHDNAHAYQVRCKKVGTFSLPILVEEDGASLERNGYMPPAKDPDSLNRLKIVYGAMPPHLTPEYVKTERFVKQLKNLIPALEQVLEATAEVSEVESGHEADRWRHEINSLTKELDDLTSRGTPPSRRGGGAGGRSAGKVARANGGGSSSSSSSSLGKRNGSGGGGRASSGGGGKSSKRRKSSEAAAGAGAGTGAGGRPVKRSRSRR
ncbi:unnamed protein product [Ectocarpus sp. 12 AP-2014]